MDLCCRASCSSIRLKLRMINWSTRFFLHDPVTYLLRFWGPRDPPRFVSRSLRSQKVGGGIGLRHVGINREPLALDQVRRHAGGNDTLEDVANVITYSQAIGPIRFTYTGVYYF